MKHPLDRIISRTTMALLLLSAVTAATLGKMLGAPALRLRSGSSTEAEPGQPAAFQATSAPPPTSGQAQEKKPAPPPTQTQPKAEQPVTAPRPAAEPGATQPAPSAPGVVSFNLQNADLAQFISVVARELKMNYIVDSAVKGTVTISTSGDLRREDLLPILESVLKVNGATAVRTGNFFRIIPSAQAAKNPVEVFKTPFLTDSGVAAVHEAGNILILADTSLNVKRLMEIIEEFDSATLARQRIQLMAVENNVASGLVPELESIFSAYAFAEKTTPIRFVAIDRINSILVVTPDPSAFEEVQKWVEKLDQPAPPSGVQTFIYRVQNSEADYLANILGRMQGSQEAPSQARPGGTAIQGGGEAKAGARGPSATREVSSSASEIESGQTAGGGVRVTTDPVNNALIFQCTAQQYSEILNTLKQLDVIPREVMIEARVYEVTLTGNLSFGVDYFLQQRSGAERKPLGSFSAANALQASAGTLIGQTRELMAFLNASENRSRVRVLSAPTLLATDNSDARIQVGSEIPILTSQGVVPVQTGGSSLFTNTIQNRDTGIILSVIPRITSTGLVSLKISQEISSAQPPPAGSIQSPSFLKRSITTRAVVANGQTIGLGGLIQSSVTTTKNRIPLLGDIPGLGVLFGNTSYNQTRTELIVLLTPHIIKSSEEANDATRQLREGLLDLRKGFKKDKSLNH